MVFTLLSSNTSELSLRMSNIDISIVNAIRRIILAEVPNIAVSYDPYEPDNSDITIYTNTSSLHNEFLSHRISLIPLCFTEDIIDNYERENYRFVLKKKNIGTEIISVTTSDIEIYDKNNVKYPESFKNMIFPKNNISGDHILIVKLKPNLYDVNNGEELNIEFYASKNIAKKHARWSPVSKCTFHNTLDEVTIEKVRKDVDKTLLNTFDTLHKYRYFMKNKYDEANSFDFEIETECRLSPIYLLKKAFKILINKVEKFKEEMYKLDVEVSEITENMFTIRIHDSHTLLNVLQSLIFQKVFRELNPEDNELEFIGYNQPHPLEDVMVLKLKFKNETTKEEMNNFLKEQCTSIISILDTLYYELDNM